MDRVRDVFGLAFSLALLSLVSCDVLSMGSMINWEDKSTNNVFDVMTRFNLYGCYCGFGGQGRPVDKIDCCCQAHDECYDRLASDGICQGGDAGVGMVYKYTKTNNDGKHNIECKPSSNQCAQEVCECDKALADCFSENEPSYNKAHRNYDRKKKCDSQKGLRAEFCPNFNE